MTTHSLDRADRMATAITQILTTALRARLNGAGAEVLAAAQAVVVDLLRAEIRDTQQQTRDDIRLRDP